MPETTLRKRKADAYGIGSVPSPVYWAFRATQSGGDSFVWAGGVDASGAAMSGFQHVGELTDHGIGTGPILEPILSDESGLVSPASLAVVFRGTSLADGGIQVWDPTAGAQYAWQPPSGTNPRFVGGVIYRNGKLWTTVAWRDDADDQKLQVRVYRFGTDLSSPTVVDDHEHTHGVTFDGDIAPGLVARFEDSLIVWQSLDSWDVLPTRVDCTDGSLAVGAVKDYTGLSNETPPSGILSPASGASGRGSIPQDPWPGGVTSGWMTLADNVAADPLWGSDDIWSSGHWAPPDGSEAITNETHGSDAVFVDPGTGAEISRIPLTDLSFVPHVIARAA